MGISRTKALAVMSMPLSIFTFLVILICCSSPKKKLSIHPGDHISLIGGNMGSRMMNFGYFETELHLRFPDYKLFIRNMCDGGDTPGFRPHSARMNAWAFPGAEKFQTDFAVESESKGVFPTPDQWLERLQTDIIVAFFGYSESFEGEAGVENFKAELEAFINYTLTQKYNGHEAPQLAFVSPTAFQDLSDTFDLPDGTEENKNLELYTNAIAAVAEKHDLVFVNAFEPSKEWFAEGKQFTIDGVQLNEEGYARLSTFLADQLFEKRRGVDRTHEVALRKAVLDKNWFWHSDYKIPNGVHVYGRRHKPFGVDNYPEELVKVSQMTANRDTMIWHVANGELYDLALADANTLTLSPIETNFEMGKSIPYLYGKEAQDKFKLAPGFKIELFASEEEFPDLANPSQISFDGKGRLWVAVMPTYPHYRPGDPMPNDKIIILEDTDGDFKADKQITFADHLQVPAGFELTPEGVYISQGTNLKLYTDTNNDDKADKVEIVLSGFDDHDTHHVISAFCADPSGAIYMGEGVFLHSNVETPYGTVRTTNGGFMRYSPQQKKLERIAQLPIPNPWGIAFDEWGQCFFESTSNPDVFWMVPGTSKSIYGYSTPIGKSIIEEKHRVRPTSGLEFVYSRHFPDEIQGDLMLNNTIGFLGTKMHQVQNDGTGFKTKHRMDLVSSSDPNFRPVDMEFAPDGSLYLADWHNVLIGHMQHNARDPLRDHVHGRIYRITYPSRPLVVPAVIDGASIGQLLDNLKLPEYRTRYRTRRELRGRDKEEVFEMMQGWVSRLDKTDPNYEHHLLEAFWVSWGINKIDQQLLATLLASKDERVRAAVIHAVRFNAKQITNQSDILIAASNDVSGRVRMEALVAGTWQDNSVKQAILENIEKNKIDDWLTVPYNFIVNPSKDVKDSNLKNTVDGKSEVLAKGKELYMRDASCVTCHQTDGKGLEAAGFPPLAGSSWVTNNNERLIKLVLNGVYGPMEVNGKSYPGNVPMTPFGGLLDDKEMAAVLNYIQNSFGNTSSELITPDQVRSVREKTKEKKGYYTPDELLKLHPDEK